MGTIIRLSVLAAVLISRPLAAQRASELRVGLTSPVATVPSRDAVEAALRPVHKSYWREGGVITAVVGVMIALAVLPRPNADTGGTTSIGDWFLRTALVGVASFVPGALVGALIPKR